MHLAARSPGIQPTASTSSPSPAAARVGRTARRARGLVTPFAVQRIAYVESERTSPTARLRSRSFTSATQTTSRCPCRAAAAAVFGSGRAFGGPGPLLSHWRLSGDGPAAPPFARRSRSRLGHRRPSTNPRNRALRRAKWYPNVVPNGVTGHASRCPEQRKGRDFRAFSK